MIKLLDHGYIRLVDSMGSDLSIARAARVSYNTEWRAGEDVGSDAKLINYLMANGHNTPFESVEFQFEIKAPIFVLRQWHRHRTWSYNEVSARYTELPEEFYLPSAELIGKQTIANKQVRKIESELTEGELYSLGKDLQILNSHNRASFAVYKMLLRAGWPRELARSVLPVSTYSHMFAKVNLHNLFKFLYERCHSHAQYEIKVYANAILELISPIVPVALAVWKKQNASRL